MTARITGTQAFLAALQGNFGFSGFAHLVAGDGKYTAIDLLDAVYASNRSRGAQDAARAAGVFAGVLTLEAAKRALPAVRAVKHTIEAAKLAAEAAKVATAHYAWVDSDKSPLASKLAVQAGDEVAQAVARQDFQDAGQRARAIQLALPPRGALAGSRATSDLSDPPGLHGWSGTQKAAAAGAAALGLGLLVAVLTREHT
jgi:hypothetical protein